MKYTIGVDLGGTNIAVGLVDGESKTILRTASTKTRAPRPCKEIAEDIATLVRTLCEEEKIALSDVEWIGIASPGIVKENVVLFADNLGWKGKEPIAEYVSALTGRPSYAANDANAAAYAEALWGAGRGVGSLVMLTLGTGVGGGIVINGAIWDGFNGFAAEIGHMIISRGGRERSCGKRGCLEAYCSATALIRESKRIMNFYPDSLMWQKAGDSFDGVSGKTAFEAAKEGDFAARIVIEDYVDALAVGVSNIINIFQPHVVVIGGGISREGDGLMKPLCDRISRMYFGFEHNKTKILAAKFRNDAGIIGAALLGLQNA